MRTLSTNAPRAIVGLVQSLMTSAATGFVVSSFVAAMASPVYSSVLDQKNVGFDNDRGFVREACSALGKYLGVHAPWHKVADWIPRGDVRHFLDGDQGIKELNLSYLHIGDKGAGLIADSLPTSQVTHLYLNKCDIGDDGFRFLAEALMQPTCRVTHLDLGENSVGDSGLQSLANALKHKNCQVTVLGLGWNLISNAGVHYLSEALRDQNCKLTDLDLCYNYIGSAGAQSLAMALATNRRLARLDLSCGRIGNAGVKFLVDAVIGSQLLWLSLEDNGISDEGAICILDVLNKNYLRSVELRPGNGAQSFSIYLKLSLNGVDHRLINTIEMQLKNDRRI
ncbi:MAG: hypothetical protein NTX76_00030 [Alphaproteobacteria bacterium]|nr:hypothetical protein [Alphaproteobacteria bacterium]